MIEAFVVEKVWDFKTFTLVGGKTSATIKVGDTLQAGEQQVSVAGIKHYRFDMETAKSGLTCGLRFEVPATAFTEGMKLMTNHQHTCCERFPIGVYLREEMECREWDYETLSARSGLRVGDVSDIVTDSRKASEEELRMLARAFGVSEELFINLSGGDFTTD
jgi:plasmid maintenance system antidote protein VapI